MILFNPKTTLGVCHMIILADREAVAPEAKGLTKVP